MDNSFSKTHKMSKYFLGLSYYFAHIIMLFDYNVKQFFSDCQVYSGDGYIDSCQSPGIGGGESGGTSL